MYAKSTRPSAKREVQKERSAKRDVQKFRSAQRDDRIARPRRAQILRAKRAIKMCPRSGQIFIVKNVIKNEKVNFAPNLYEIRTNVKEHNYLF